MQWTIIIHYTLKKSDAFIIDSVEQALAMLGTIDFSNVESVELKRRAARNA